MKTLILLGIALFTISCKKCYVCTTTITSTYTETVNPYPGSAWTPKTITDIMTTKSYPCATKKDIKKLEQTQSKTIGTVTSTITIKCANQ